MTRSEPSFVDFKFEPVDRLCDFQWLCKLAYLADIYSHLNRLNPALHGKSLHNLPHTQNRGDCEENRSVGERNYESFENIISLLKRRSHFLTLQQLYDRANMCFKVTDAGLLLWPQRTAFDSVLVAYGYRRELSNKAIMFLMLVDTTYLREAGFFGASGQDQVQEHVG